VDQWAVDPSVVVDRWEADLSEVDPSVVDWWEAGWSAADSWVVDWSAEGWSVADWLAVELYLVAWASTSVWVGALVLAVAECWSVQE
jgi:hypothetical protein